MDIRRLAQGLATTKVQTLTLSTGLNSLHIGRFPRLTSFILDYSGPNPFMTIHRGCFGNVTTLKIQCIKAALLMEGSIEGHRWRLSTLLRCLPSVRTLELESGAVIEKCSIPAFIETIIIRPAEFDAVNWAQDHLRKLAATTSALRYIELHQRNDWPVLTSWNEFEYFANKAGVKVVVKIKGQVWKVFE